MNMRSNKNRRGEKLLFSSLTAAALAMVSTNPKLVKADNISSNKVSVKSKNICSPDKRIKYSQSIKTETLNNLESEENVPAEADSFEKNVDESQDSVPEISTTQSARETSPSISPKSSTKWNNLDVDFDAGILTIYGNDQTIANPDCIFSNLDNISDRSITKIKLDGKLKITGSAKDLFSYLINLEEIQGLENLDTSEVTNMSSMFAHINVSSLDLSNFDTAKVENMSNMFSGCSSLKQLDLSNFVTTKVTNMSNMFSLCENLTELDLRSFETATVENMSEMFYECYDLALLNIDTNKFNTKNVVDMSSMFSNCENLSTVDVSKFDTKKVTSMSCMFMECENLAAIDVSNFDTRAVADMSGMFNGCRNLKVLDLRNFYFNEDSQTDPEMMLADLDKLNTLRLGPNFLYELTTFTELNTEGIWLNVGNQTETDPQGSQRWTSRELIENYDKDHPDTYVRIGHVNVHYVNKDTNETISPNKISKGKTGDSGVIIAPVLNGYTINSKKINDAPATSSSPDTADVVYGNISETSQEVTFFYTEDPLAANGSVTVRYQDENGNQISSDTELIGTIGEIYTTSAKTIAGYTLKTTPTNATGLFTETPQTVIYIYSSDFVTPEPPAENGLVNVHYQDENGNQISPNTVLSGKVGTSYVTSAKTITGYTLKSTPSNATGLFSALPQDVIYIYEKENSNPETPSKTGVVTVHYQDKNGNSIASNTVLTGKIGTSYVTSAKVIKGYTLKISPANAKGLFNEAPQTVVYVYSKIIVDTSQVNKKPHLSTAVLKNPTPNISKDTPVDSNELPKTGLNNQSKLISLILGTLSLIGTLSGAWLNRKKSKLK